MPLVRTEAVILKTTDYSETSKVCRAYTLEHGLQSVIAKGLRRPGSRLLGVLETLNHVDLIYYKKRNRSLFTLSQATIIETYSGLSGDLHRYYRAAALAEMVLRLGVEEEGNEQMFRLFTHALGTISRRPIKTLGDRTLSYIWGILAILGYAPGLAACVNCGGAIRDENRVSFSVRGGGVVCHRCEKETAGESYVLSGRMYRVLSADRAGHVVGLSGREEEVLLGLTEEYVSYHIQDRRPMMCWDFLKSLGTGQEATTGRG